MPDSTEPRYVGRSAEADRLADRWDELEASVAAVEPRFDRTFRTRIFLRDDEMLSLTSLDDDFHEMRIALRLANDGTIVEATGRMNRHPYDTCPRAVESFAALAGVNVYMPRAPQDARMRIPRSEGCQHIVDMLGVAIRAFRIAKGHDIPHHGESGRREFLRLLPNVRDTCVSFAVE